MTRSVKITDYALRQIKSINFLIKKINEKNPKTNELLRQLISIQRTSLLMLYGYLFWHKESTVEIKKTNGEKLGEINIFQSDKQEYITSINRSLAMHSWITIEQFIRSYYKKNDYGNSTNISDIISNLRTDKIAEFPQAIDILRHLRNTTHTGKHTKNTTTKFLCKGREYQFEKNMRVPYFHLDMILDMIDDLSDFFTTL